MSLTFWISLLVAVVVLGGVSLGAYLVAARKLYSNDKQLTARSQGKSPKPSGKKSKGEGSGR